MKEYQKNQDIKKSYSLTDKIAALGAVLVFLNLAGCGYVQGQGIEQKPAKTDAKAGYSVPATKENIEQINADNGQEWWSEEGADQGWNRFITEGNEQREKANRKMYEKFIKSVKNGKEKKLEYSITTIKNGKFDSRHDIFTTKDGEISWNGSPITLEEFKENVEELYLE